MHHLVTITSPSDDGAIEMIVDRLWVAGAAGVEDLGGSIRAAFVDPDAAAMAASEYGGLVEATADTTGLDDWRDHATVHRAGPFHLRPPWLEPPARPEFLDLVIDPGHAFGSGSHASTRLALSALADVMRPGDRVLDLGTGSGVLAIAAALLGATAIGIDTDPAAAPAVHANALANGVSDRVEAVTGDIAALSLGPAELAVLNVTIDIHETVAPAVRQLDPPRLIVAGVLAGEQANRCARLHGRAPVAELIDGEWAALVFDHGRPASPS